MSIGRRFVLLLAKSYAQGSGTLMQFPRRQGIALMQKFFAPEIVERAFAVLVEHYRSDNNRITIHRSEFDDAAEFIDRTCARTAPIEQVTDIDVASPQLHAWVSAQVAVHVFGEATGELVRVDENTQTFDTAAQGLCPLTPYASEWQYIPKLLEWLAQEGWIVVLNFGPVVVELSFFHGGETFSASGFALDDVPLLLCTTALKHKGIEV